MKQDPAFIFDSYTFDPISGQMTMRYVYENGPEFIEKIDFPVPTRALSADDLAALDTAARLLFLLAGVSYYKAYIPHAIICRAFPLDAATAAFVENVYRHGLGEFAYRNGLDLTDRCRFVTDNAAPAPRAVSLKLESSAMIPVGGGKDSCVTIETVKGMGVKSTLFVMTSPAGVAAPIQHCIDVSGLKSYVVTRTLSPMIVDVNKAGAYNGHIPITAILSVVAVMSAILNGDHTVILSNEHSASAPNLVHNGQDVNHQYSKSLAFETALSGYITAHITPNLTYFSLLRPMTEALILKRFSRLGKYHNVFRSCNTAFKQDAAARGTHWCGNCPKCRFVFLGLSPFMPRDKIVGIFSTDLLGDMTQYDGFAELCGVSAHKPFECVGETYECALMLAKSAQSPEWANADVVQKLVTLIMPNIQNLDVEFNDLFRLRADHRVPDLYLKAIS